MFFCFELLKCHLSNTFEIAVWSLNVFERSGDLEASPELASIQRMPQPVSSHLLPPATVTDAKASCCHGSFNGPSAQLALPSWAELWRSVWRAPAMLSLPSSWQAGFTRSSWDGPGVEVGFPPFSTSATWTLLAVDSQRHKSDGCQYIYKSSQPQNCCVSWSHPLWIDVHLSLKFFHVYSHQNLRNARLAESFLSCFVNKM